MFAPIRARAAFTAPAEPVAGKHIIDELLEERTERLRRVPLLWAAIQRWCLPFFKYHDAVGWADRLGPCGGYEALHLLDDYLDLRVDVRGLAHVPRRGRLLIVANHPTGIVDAFAIYDALSAVRPDLCFFTNRDMVRIVPGTRELVIPVEWLRHRRSPERMRETLAATNAALAKERAVVIFPGGGIARWRAGAIRDLPWQTTTLKLLRKWPAPVLPLHIRARNSLLYYALEQIDDEARDLLRFREVLAKRGKRFELTIGPVVSGAVLHAEPAEAIRRLQALVEHKLARRRHRA